MINAGTDLYCIFGSPVGHSKSPLIHNTLFAHYNINAAYLAFEIQNIKEGIDAVRSLGIKGASITIPFKESIIPYVDDIAEDARQMGAVNTIVNQNGRLYGYNTDCMGAITPLKSIGIKGKKIAVIGAGGAAMAVVYGVLKSGGTPFVINRTVDKAKAMATRFNCEYVALAQLQEMPSLSADIIINTTSVGMVPDTEYSPLPERLLSPHMVVMDVVYTPLQTRLLKQAVKKGCQIVDGLAMFLHQGAAQFELWTGISPDMTIMRQTAIDDLEVTS